jgi:fructokinase
MLGAIEAGGTKFVCGIGTGPDDLKIVQFPTSAPELTVQQAVTFFREEAGRRLEAIGIGSFGPIDLHRSSPTYGHITSTPKPGWANYDLVGSLTKELDVPIWFDTDVNAALLGENKWGAAQGLTDAIYLTIGTGVGGGAMVFGHLLHGLVHPEIGHLRLPHDLSRDPFPGICPYHGDCLEGLACGPAMQARWGAPAGTLASDHEAWALEAHYLALALVNLTVTLSPQRILLGGGVMQQAHLFDLIRRDFKSIMNNYLENAELNDHLDRFIQPPGLAGRSGVLGALVLASWAASDATLSKSVSAWSSPGGKHA